MVTIQLQPELGISDRVNSHDPLFTLALRMLLLVFALSYR